MLIILRLDIYMLCCWNDTNHIKFSIIKLIIISKLKRERQMTLLLTLVILTLDIIYYVIEATPIILSFFY